MCSTADSSVDHGDPVNATVKATGIKSILQAVTETKYVKLLMLILIVVNLLMRQVFRQLE